MNKEEWEAMIQKNAEELVAQGPIKMQSRTDAHWEGIADVDWEDLRFFLEKSRRDKDAESFDTAIRVLTALRKQILERKVKK